MSEQQDIQTLVQMQLDAYNAGQLDAFVACFHPAVEVLEGGERTVEGRAAFRDRFADLFSQGGFGASVPARLHEGPHCVDLEVWWQKMPNGETESGRLLVRYTARDGLIGVVEYLD